VKLCLGEGDFDSRYVENYKDLQEIVVTKFTRKLVSNVPLLSLCVSTFIKHMAKHVTAIPSL